VALASRVSPLWGASTLGKVILPPVSDNAPNILRFLKADEVQLFDGTMPPSDRSHTLVGDGAPPVIKFLPEDRRATKETQGAVEFIQEALNRLPKVGPYRRLKFPDQYRPGFATSPTNDEETV